LIFILFYNQGNNEKNNIGKVMKISLSRKKFLRYLFRFNAGLALYNKFLLPQTIPASGYSGQIQAEHWESLSDNKIRCLLCPNKCILSPGQNGLCYSRGNRNGVHYSLVYGLPAIIAQDTIEKSPLYHFYPGISAFSIATSGCNLSCQFCQNWQYSQTGPENVKNFILSPEEVIKKAKKFSIQSINFFYTEPTIYFEYVKAIARLAKKEKLKTVCVTAGYINDKPLGELIELIDAFVFGLKGFDENFYQKYIGCGLEHIKRSLKQLAESKNRIWFEIVNLLVPTLNDNMSTVTEMCSWLAEEVGVNVPLHFTRFEPKHILSELPPTPISTIKKAYSIAKSAGIKHVYIGNLPGHDESNTMCPGCGKTVIERLNFSIIKNIVKRGKCPFCQYQIEGVWV